MTIEQQVHDYRGYILQSAHGKNIKKYCGKRPRLYDLACGIGAIIPYIHDSDYTGIDIDPERINTARKKYPSCDFRVGDCTQTELPTQSADCVLSCETFEHIPDWLSFVRELNRVLKNGGILLFSTPTTNLYCYPSYFIRMLLFNRPAALRKMFHWLYDWKTACDYHPSTTKKDIISVLKLAGFEILEYKTVLSFYEHHYIYRLLLLWEKIQPDSNVRNWLCDKWMKTHNWLTDLIPQLGTRHIIVGRKA